MNRKVSEYQSPPSLAIREQNTSLETDSGLQQEASLEPMATPSTRVRLVTTEMGDGNRDLNAHRSALQNTWDNNVADGSGNYDLFADFDDTTNISIDNPDDIDNALTQARKSSKVQNILDGATDGVLVLDSRNYDNYTGYGYIDVAGSDYAVAIVGGQGGKQTTVHECGHLYGGRHGDTKSDEGTFENFGLYDYTVMGVGGTYGCNDNTPASVREMTYSSCTINTIRSYIDSNL